MDFLFGILGIAGGLLCATGDILFDLKGKGNQKLGSKKMLESNWGKMAPWRFKASILFAAAGVPLYFLGLLSLSNQLSQANQTLGLLFFIFSVVGATGGLFIHVVACLVPIVFKSLHKKTSFETIDDLVNTIFDTVKIPFVIQFCSLVVFTSIVLIIAILTGSLHVSKIFLVANPLGLMVIGVLLRLANRNLFNDLPGIIMPSMGLSMVGLMTALNSVA